MPSCCSKQTSLIIVASNVPLCFVSVYMGFFPFCWCSNYIGISTNFVGLR